jgi:hypothetical protein
LGLLRFLPPKPTIGELETEVEQLLKDLGAQNPLAEARFASILGDIPSPPPDVGIQEVIAGEYGYDSWGQLREHVGMVEEVENDIERLRDAYGNANSVSERASVIEGHHSMKRFENLDPSEPFLSDHDARVLLANKRGYAHWVKYHAYIHLLPEVRKVIDAIEKSDIARLGKILVDYPHASNPKWVPGFLAIDSRFKDLINDCIPLFRVSRAVYEGHVPAGETEYAFIKLLAEYGADIEFDNGHPLNAAISFRATEAVRALLELGALPNGPGRDGTPISIAVRFGSPEIINVLIEAGAKEKQG